VGRLPMRTVSLQAISQKQRAAKACIFNTGHTATMIERPYFQKPNAALCNSACKIHYAIENTDLSPCVWSYYRGSAMLDGRNYV